MHVDMPNETLDTYRQQFAAEKKSGTLTGYSLVFIPRSWAVGVWRRPRKTIYALGPFRWAVHYGLGDWKPKPVAPHGEREGFHGGARSGELGFDG